MPRPSGVANPADLLQRLNLTVEEVEQEIAGKQILLAATKQARDALTKGLLSTNGHTPRSRRKSSEGSTATRVAMLTTILEHAPQPVTVDEIITELAKHGRVEHDRRNVYSTLSYMKGRLGTAKTVERGRWVSVTQNGKKAAA